MSAPVDVMAVLDYEIRTMRLTSIDWGPQRAVDQDDLLKARAAIAELIQAVKQYESEFTNPAPDYQRRSRRRDEMFAALRRAGGAE